MLRRWISLLVLLAWLLPAPSWAAITQVASMMVMTDEAFGASLALVYPNSNTVGNLMVACGNVQTNGFDPVSVTVVGANNGALTVVMSTQVDTGGAWAGGYQSRTWIAYKVVSSGGAADTLTVTPNNHAASSTVMGITDEFTGTHATTPLRNDGGSTQDGSGTSHSNTVTTVSGDLVVGMIESVTATDPTLALPSGYTSISNYTSGGNAPYGRCDFKVVSGTSEVTTWGSTISFSTLQQTLAFQPAAAGGGGTVKHRVIQ